MAIYESNQIREEYRGDIDLIIENNWASQKTLLMKKDGEVKGLFDVHVLLWDIEGPKVSYLEKIPGAIAGRYQGVNQKAANLAREKCKETERPDLSEFEKLILTEETLKANEIADAIKEME